MQNELEEAIKYEIEKMLELLCKSLFEALSMDIRNDVL